MALALTLREGHDFFIGDRKVVIYEVRTPMDFDILDTGLDLLARVVADDWTGLIGVDGVRLQAGIPRKQEGKIVRILVEAPGHKVLRGDLYRAQHPSCKTCQGTGKLWNSVPCAHCHGHGCKRCSGTGTIDHSFNCPECGAHNHKEQ